MIVDFHTHVFSPDVIANREDYIRRDRTFASLYGKRKAKLATAEDLLASMERAGVDVSVALGFAWSEIDDCRRHNDYLLDCAARSSGGIVAFCAAQPASGIGGREEIGRCAGLHARGLGELRPQDQGYRLVDSDEEAILARAANLDLTLLFHVTEPVGHAYPGKGGLPLEDFTTFVMRHPGVRVVGAHWGGGLPYFALMPEVKAALTNTYFDTAASRFLYSPEIYRAVIDRVGPERVLFGSDFPLVDQRAAIVEIRDAGLNEREAAAVLGGNAARLLGLE